MHSGIPALGPGDKSAAQQAMMRGTDRNRADTLRAKDELPDHAGRQTTPTN